MRKLSGTIVLLVLAALMVSACTGAATPAAPASTATTGTGTGAGTAVATGTGTVTTGTGTATTGTATTGTATTGTVTTGTATTGTATTGTSTVVPSTGAGTGTVAPTSATGTTTGTSTANQTTTPGAGTAYPAGTGTATNGTPSAANATSTVSSGNIGATANAGAGTATASSGGVGTTVPTPVTTGTAAAGTSSSGSGTSTGSTGSTGTSGTPGAFTQGQLIKLSDVLKSSVSGSNQAALGRVDGLLIERPVLPGEGQPTPEAGQATATPVPTTGAPQQVYVRYILVNVAAANANGQTGSAATPQGGNQVVIPWQAVTGASSAQGAQALIVNATASDLAAAPHTTLLDIASGSVTWMNPVASYWGSHGVAIPTTGQSSNTSGAQAKTSLLFIPRERGGIDIVDATDTAVGQVGDFLIDGQSGEVMYVVFNLPTANNQTIAIPMRNLTWTLGQGAAQITNRGALRFNFDVNALKNFPNLGDLSNLTTDPNVLNQLNNFWNSIQGSGTSK